MTLLDQLRQMRAAVDAAHAAAESLAQSSGPNQSAGQAYVLLRVRGDLREMGVALDDLIALCEHDADQRTRHFTRDPGAALAVCGQPLDDDHIEASVSIVLQSPHGCSACAAEVRAAITDGRTP